MMKAMILAAGMATRLRPISDTTPKALVELGGTPMLQIVVEKLIRAGVTDIVVNVHHHADQMKAFIASLHDLHVRLHISDETSLLLDTGGGVKKARTWLDGDMPFFVYNIDILSAIDLADLYQAHLAGNALATLAVSDRPSSRYFLWDGDKLAGWEHSGTGERILCRGDKSHPTKEKENMQRQQTKPYQRKAFTGIAVISPAIFDLMPDEPVFSIKDVYLRLAGDWPIRCYNHEHTSWHDIGTPEKLAHAHRYVEEQQKKNASAP